MGFRLILRRIALDAPEIRTGYIGRLADLRAVSGK